MKMIAIGSIMFSEKNVHFSIMKNIWQITILNDI